MRHLLSLVIAFLGFTALPALGDEPTSSQEIYVSKGEHGEMSFSDVAGPGAERVEIAGTPPARDSQQELERRIRQTLSVANALEASRLAREKARAEARAASQPQPEPQPEVVYRDRYVTNPYVLGGPYDRLPNRRDDRFDRHRRDRDDRRAHEEHTISKKFLYEPD